MATQAVSYDFLSHTYLGLLRERYIFLNMRVVGCGAQTYTGELSYRWEAAHQQKRWSNTTRLVHSGWWHAERGNCMIS